MEDALLAFFLGFVGGYIGMSLLLAVWGGKV